MYASTGSREKRLRWPAQQVIQTVYKPGSVHISRHWTAIPLGQALRRASRDQPGRRNGNLPASMRKHEAGRPYSVLLPVGFTLPALSPGPRCALTAPFHPCHRRLRASGGLFSVALSLGSPPPAVSRHRIPMEPGLSSTSVLRRQRPSNRLDFCSLRPFQGAGQPGALNRYRAIISAMVPSCTVVAPRSDISTSAFTIRSPGPISRAAKSD